MNKGFWFLFIPYIILFIADLITTLMNYKFLKYIELNPLFNIGGIIPIIILNILFLGIIWKAYHYKNSNPTIRFVYIMVMITIILLRITAVSNALTWVGQDITVEEVKEQYTPEVIQQEQINYLSIIYSPIIFCFIVFLFWKWDHIIERKDIKRKKRKK